MAGPVALIQGGGELGSAVAHAFARAGLRVLVVDRPLPGALRLHVAFCNAAARPDGRQEVGGVTAVHCLRATDVEMAWRRGEIALWTGGAPPLATAPDVLIDARMRALSEPLRRKDEAPLVIGLGPGFEAGRDVHFVVETNRGPRLGEPIERGYAEEHTGVPGDVLGQREARLLRSPCAGRIERVRGLGEFVDADDVVALVAGEPVRARLGGMIRGLKLDGVEVGAGHKIGDVDPRRDPTLLHQMTDKALAVARGALRALAAAGIPLRSDPPLPRNIPCI